MLAALLVTAVAALDPGPQTPGPYAILPGNEPLVRALLEDPGVSECRCTGLSIARDHLVGRYLCGETPHAVALHAPETPGAIRKTGKFALFTSSEQPFPSELLAGIERSVRARESAWRWEKGWASEAGGDGKWPLMDCFTALFAIGLTGSLWRRKPRDSSPADDPKLRWLEAAAVTALAGTALMLTRHSPPVNLDTARDLLIARDLSLGRDELPAIPSSFPHARLLHGGLWLRLLSAGWRFGLPLGLFGQAVEWASALSVGLTYLVARRRTGIAAALPGAALQLVLLHHVTERPVLWNPALLPLLVTAFAAAIVLHAESGGIVSLLLAGLFAGAATQAHVLMVTLLPTLLFSAVLRSGLMPAMAALGAFGAAWSMGAEVASTGQLRLALGAPWLMAGLAGVVGVGLVARRKGLPAHQSTLALALLVGIAATALVARTATSFAPRYAAPLLGLGPLAIALVTGKTIGAAVRKGRRALQIATIASLGVTTLVIVWGYRSWQRHPVDGAAWTLDDARRVARALRAEGFSPRDLMNRLESPHSPRALLGAMLALDDGATGGLEASRRMDAPLVFKTLEAAPALLPTGWKGIALEQGTALYRSRHSVVRNEALELCVETTGPSEKRCAETTPELRDVEAFSQRAYPSLAGEPPVDLTRPFELRATLPYRIPEGEGPVTIHTPGEGRRWRIESVEGSPSADGLPGQRVVLGPGPAEGRIVLSYRCSEAPCLGDAVDWRPEIIETTGDDAPLLPLMPLAN